jgi:hypothetical protein
LILGTADAGLTVHNDDEKAKELMKEVGKQLNLRPHPVRDEFEISTPVDLEVHIGTDERLYCLDFSRY